MRTPRRRRTGRARRLATLSAAALAPALLAPALGGCTGHRSPSAAVTAAGLVDRSPEAAVIEFEILTTNPNDFELPMREIAYTLSVDGSRVFSGERAAVATIPRNGSQTVTIPVVVPMGEGGVAPGLHPYTLSGRIRYSLPSQLADVLFDARLSRPSMGIRDQGEIDLR